MYQEKRPTCVTVIGWAWIIIGGLMCFSSTMALIMSFEINQVSTEDLSEMPLVFRYFGLFASLQIAFGILGLVSGINFLRLKSWSRQVLEIMTWVLLLFVIGFAGFFFYQFSSMSPPDASFGFGFFEVAMIVMVFGIYGVPLGIMVKYLRGGKVKNAIADTSEHAI